MPFWVIVREDSGRWFLDDNAYPSHNRAEVSAEKKYEGKSEVMETKSWDKTIAAREIRSLLSQRVAQTGQQGEGWGKNFKHGKPPQTIT